MSVFRYEKDSDGIVVITMDMNGPVNAMNDEYEAAMAETIDRLESEQGLTGVVFASAKKVFFAGGDLNRLFSMQPGQEQEFFQSTERVKSQLRRLEKLPVPTVAAINGAALGGGFELCLACNFRIALSDPSVQLGLPEVTLGLMPGAGGVVRMVYLLGFEAALPYILEGTRLSAADALEIGLIDETVDDPAQLLPRARELLRQHQGNDDAALQPWDRRDCKIPHGDARSPKIAQAITMAAASVRKKTRGLLPAPEGIVDCAVSGLRVDFDTALRIESRLLTHLVMTPQAKNMISAFFFQMNHIRSGRHRPRGIEKKAVRKMGVLGGGTRLERITERASNAGIDVVAIGSSGSDSAEALGGCDLILLGGASEEALRASLKGLADTGAILVAVTNGMPLSRIGEASGRPERCAGLHIPASREDTPIVEIVCSGQTSDQSASFVFDFLRQLGRTPVFVSDTPAFFTSRVLGTYIDEGLRLIDEDFDPVVMENLGRGLGFSGGPLQVFDQVNRDAPSEILQSWQEAGVLSEDLRERLFESGESFYQKNDAGSARLRIDFRKSTHPDVQLPREDVKDRLLFRPVLEAARCLAEGVLGSVEEANIASLLGADAPTWTGGYLQFINTYGLDKFALRCDELRSSYGERFALPALVLDKLEKGELF